MSRKVTVPPAGVTQQFSFTGLSLYVVTSASYEQIEDTPQIAFDTGGGLYPGITRSRYPNPAGKFNSIFITGTEESAGDELVLLSLDVCVDAFINFDALATTRATLKPSFSITMSDTVQELSQLQIINDDGQLPSAMYITPTGADCRYGFDSDPGQTVAGDLAHVVLENEVQKIMGINFIQAFRFISAVSAGAGELTFTMEY